MALLNSLFPLYGAHKRSKRVGRGLGSGKGKTCGSGVKGQKSRTGVAIKGFEGGQQPIYTRLPKRGFKPLNRVDYQIISIEIIDDLIEHKVINNGDVIDPNKLHELNLIKSLSKPVKFVGNFTREVALEFNNVRLSKTLKQALENLGSKIS